MTTVNLKSNHAPPPPTLRIDPRTGDRDVDDQRFKDAVEKYSREMTLYVDRYVRQQGQDLNTISGTELDADASADAAAAQADATQALADALSAQGDADAAQSAADAAQGDATVALGELADIASDGKVTPVEKLEAKQRWNTIQTKGTLATGTIIVQAAAFSVDDSAYDTAFAALDLYLNTTISVFGDMAATTDVTRATWDSAWEAYYDAEVDLLNAISAKAKELADNAQSAADTAQGAADSAQSAADAAQGAADSAQSAADAAQGDATTALNSLSDIAADNKVTPVEKLEAKQRWLAIVEEGTATTGLIPAQASVFSVVDTDFDTAYAALDTYLNTTLSVFTNMSATTTVTRSTWDSTWKAYYDERTNLLNDIAAAAKDLADAAQADADTAQDAADSAQSDATQALADAATAQSAADSAQGDATTALNSLSDIASDSKVTPVEKLEAKVRWNAALAEGHATTGTLTLKAAEFSVDDTAYAAAYSALDTYLNTTLSLFSSMSATATVTHATWDSTWGTYYEEKVNLLNAIAEAAADAAQAAAEALAFPLASAGVLASQDDILANQIIAANLGAISAAFGEMSGGSITGTTIRTSNTGRRIQMDDDGIVFIVTDSTGKYGSFKYGDGTKYGAGWLCRFYNMENGIPFYMMNEQTVCDIHLYDRTTDPSGAAEEGDLAMVQGQLRQCSAAGTPGTWEDV